MSAQAQMVGAAGVGLIVANWATSDQRVIISGLWDGSGDPAHQDVKKLGAQILGVGVLTLMAGSSGSAGNVAVAILAAFWLIWLMKWADAKAKGQKHPTTPTLSQQGSVYTPNGATK